MVKLPSPPAPSDLADLPPALRQLPAGSLLWRLYFRGGPFPTDWDRFRTFGPTTARFDHHEPPPRSQARGTLYAAAEGPTALAEVFQETRTIDRRRRDPWLVAFRLTRHVSVLDLTGRWPTRAGASMALASGPRPRAREWARAIWEAYPGVEGLLYPSSMDSNRPALALFERAARAIPERPKLHRALLDPTLFPSLAAAAADLGYAIA